MKKIVDYRILTAQDMDKSVKIQIADGWQPLGAAVPIEVEKSNASNRNIIIQYMQTMVKYEEEDLSLED